MARSQYAYLHKLKPSVSLALGDVVPHITIQSLHLWDGEFESHPAKRLLQQYRHFSDMAQRQPRSPDKQGLI